MAARPANGAITLDQIHIDAGGISGTEASINDADIRGLIGKQANTLMSFSEWYFTTGYTVVVNNTNDTLVEGENLSFSVSRVSSNAGTTEVDYEIVRQVDDVLFVRVPTNTGTITFNSDTTINLSLPTDVQNIINGDTVGVIKIIDPVSSFEYSSTTFTMIDRRPVYGVTSANITEGDTISLSVSVSNAIAEPVSWSISGDTAGRAASSGSVGTLSADGSYSVSIPTSIDSQLQGNETWTITVQGDNSGETAQTTIVVSDLGVAFVVSDRGTGDWVEGASRTFRVTASPALPDGETIDWEVVIASSDADAVAQLDALSGTTSYSAGGTIGDFTITTTEDPEYLGTSTIGTIVIRATGRTSGAQDNFSIDLVEKASAMTISVAPVSGTEGDNFVVTVQGTNITGSEYLSVTSVSGIFTQDELNNGVGMDYSLVFGAFGATTAGVYTATFNLNTISDPTESDGGSIVLTAGSTNPSTTSNQVTVNLADDGTTAEVYTFDVTNPGNVLTEGENLTFSVTRTDGTTQTQVDYVVQDAGGQVNSPNGTLTFNSDTTLNTSLSTSIVAALGPSGGYNGTIRFYTGGTQNQIGSVGFVLNDLIPTYSVGVSDTTITEGATTTFNIGVTDSVGENLNYTITGDQTALDRITTPLTGTITSGTTNFTVQTTNDNFYHGAKTFRLEVTGAQTGSVGGTFNSPNVTLSDGPIVLGIDTSISGFPTAVDEGDTITIPSGSLIAYNMPSVNTVEAQFQPLATWVGSTSNQNLNWVWNSSKNRYEHQTALLYTTNNDPNVLTDSSVLIRFTENGSVVPGIFESIAVNNITVQPTYSVSAANITEGDNLVINLTASNPDGEIVDWTISGDSAGRAANTSGNFGSVTTTSDSVTVSTSMDGRRQGNQTWTINVEGRTSGRTASTTVTVSDQPQVVNLTAVTGPINEGDTAEFFATVTNPLSLGVDDWDYTITKSGGNFAADSDTTGIYPSVTWTYNTGNNRWESNVTFPTTEDTTKFDGGNVGARLRRNGGEVGPFVTIAVNNITNPVAGLANGSVYVSGAPNPLSAIVQFNSDGSITSTSNSLGSTRWLASGYTGSASDFDIYFHSILGSPTSGSTRNQWLNLGLSKSQGVSDSSNDGNPVTYQFDVYIRESGPPLNNTLIGPFVDGPHRITLTAETFGGGTDDGQDPP